MTAAYRAEPSEEDECEDPGVDPTRLLQMVVLGRLGFEPGGSECTLSARLQLLQEELLHLRCSIEAEKRTTDMLRPLTRRWRSAR